MAFSVFVAFVAGAVTTLSPCVLPLLPVLLASGLHQGRLRPLGIGLGFVLAFAAATLALSTAVRVLGISPDATRQAAAALLAAAGIVLAVPWLGHRFEIWSAALLPAPSSAPRTGFGGGLALGAALGVAWTPCVGPLMAAVMTLALNAQVTAAAAAIALAFATGAAVPMTAIAVGGQRVSNKFRWFQRNASGVRIAIGLVFLATAGAILSGTDRLIQAELLDLFPEWERLLTDWEPQAPSLELPVSQ